jgi:hypothetical protein
LVTSVALTILAWRMTVIAQEETAYNTSTIVAQIPTGPVWWLAAVLVWASVPLQFIVTLHIIAGAHDNAAKEDHL